MAVTSKKAKERLAYPPMTIYVEDELREWFQKHATTYDNGQPVSVANVIRKVLRDYKAKIERK